MKSGFDKVVIAICLFIVCSGSVPAKSDIKGLTKKGTELFDAGKYPAADTVFTKVVELQKQKTGINHPDYAKALNNLAKTYYKRSLFFKADSLFQDALVIRKTKCGDSSLEYAETLNDLVENKVYLQDFDGVEELINKSIEIREKKLGNKHPDYAKSILNLSSYFVFAGKPDKAEPYLKEASKILLDNFGEKNRHYAKALIGLGNYSFYKQDIEATGNYYLQAVNIFREVLGDTHPETLEAMLCLTSSKATRGDYLGTIELIQSVLPIVKLNVGQMHADYSGGLSNLATAHLMLGNYTDAEKYYKESMAISHKILGEKHSIYFNSLSGLASLYSNIGMPEKAEPLYVKSLELRKALHGNVSSSVANALNNMGVFYIEMGNYSQSEAILHEALEICKQMNITNTPLYATVLSSMGACYQGQSNPLKAVALYEEAAAILKQNNGENHSDYLKVLMHVASVKQSDPRVDRDSVESLYIEIVEKRERLFGENHPDYVVSLNNLALFYEFEKKHEKAEFLLKRALEIMSKWDGGNIEISRSILSNMAVNQECQDKYTEAQSYYLQALNMTISVVEKNFTFLSENEREHYWNKINFLLNAYHSFAQRANSKIPSVAELSYDIEIFSKSLLLNSSRQVQKSIMDSGNEHLIALWNALAEYKKSLVRIENIVNEAEKEVANFLNVNSFEQAKAAILTLNNPEILEALEPIFKLRREYVEAEQWYINEEKKVADESKAFRLQQKEFTLKWNDIRDALDEGEAVIEFICFEEYNLAENHIGGNLYGALLLSKEYQQPILVSLCPEEKLQAAIKKSAYDSKEVYPLIWKPLVKHLKGISNIYIAPAGLLHSVSFAGMKIGKKYLSEEYTIHNLLSTKDIITLKEKNTELALNTLDKKAVLFGGADFGLPNNELALLDSDLKDGGQYNLMRGMLDQMDPTRGQGFDYLPGSKKEVQVINSQLQELNWETSLFVDMEATEARFKSYSSLYSPQLMHVSTHGFYFPLVKESSEIKNLIESPDAQKTYRLSDNPLMRSGLAFTGANHVWSGKDPAEGHEDGILTAYEVSALNLSNTELLVLSACETGLGDAVGSEGVYGLQRAFRLAGVQSMIVSLWKVPDAETVNLMNEFYAQWAKGLTRKEAFTQAQDKMRNTHPSNPEKWAGFVLIE